MEIKRLLLCGLCCVCGLLANAAQKSDTFETPGGKTVIIHHIKHGSLHIEYEGRHIYVDPVGQPVKPVTDYSVMPRANIVLITHEHQDHYDPLALPQVWTPATGVYANPSVHGMLHRGMAMKNGDSIQYSNDIKIWAVPAYNSTVGREQFHPKGRDNGYILQLDGLRIYIAGDTEDIPEMADVKDIDIAFLPCNQPYTMTIDQVVKVTNIIKPKVLFPYHYGETPVSQVKLKLANSGTEVRIRDYK